MTTTDELRMKMEDALSMKTVGVTTTDEHSMVTHSTVDELRMMIANAATKNEHTMADELMTTTVDVTTCSG